MASTSPENLTEDFEELFGVNAGYVAKVYGDFMSSPESVGEEWQRFFKEHGLQAPDRPAPATLPPEAPVAQSASTNDAPAEPDIEPMRGVAAKIVQNMEASLGVPTATSTRTLPVKVLEENRRIINQHLAGEFRGKASFTHIIAWAMVQALKLNPAMTTSYLQVDGKPHKRLSGPINLGIAVDLPGKNGERNLLVPNIKDCGSMEFAEFLASFNAQIGKARKGKLTPADFQGTSCTLTNPGMIGTVSSLPRLMQGQSFILATGSIQVPAEFQGAALSTLSELGISKVMTITNTYDHRVVQGAVSGEFLASMHRMLIGESQELFYERLFRSLQIPHQPMRFTQDLRAALGSPLRDREAQERAARVMQYIRSYRVRGYLLSNLDPLEYKPVIFPELEMHTYGLTIWDLDREFFSSGVTGKPLASLREIHEVLRATYTRHVGIEFMHIADPAQKEWLRARIEGNQNEEELPREVMLRAMDRLVEAEAFERFLHTRFVGHKRFSLEGAETLVPTLDALLDLAVQDGVGRVVLGMAHRGRLNVLAHILGKPLSKIFSEFEGQLDPNSTQGSGDVKYHLGANGDYQTLCGSKVRVELSANPSHLEAVNPVVEGIARARQDQHVGDGSHDSSDNHDNHGRKHILPVLIHGDAAFAGQGVVTETLNMSQLRGYRTGGTIHIIVNNQIGYTTLPGDARSTHYCSDIAKSIQAPIFHVNGDDPLAAVRMIRLAFWYRQEFQRDVVLDIVCYRRHGHNEGDEPSFTQPLLYQKIENHPSVRETYQQFLLRAGVIKADDIEKFDAELQQKLRDSLASIRNAKEPEVLSEKASELEAWPKLLLEPVGLDQLQGLMDKLAAWPSELTMHPKVQMILRRRQAMVAGEQPVDFATAEHLAFASLLTAGRKVRLAGQDSGRGTFSQRHSVLLDVNTAEKYLPLNFLHEDQARYMVVDSFLSEEAAMGFEYGYSVVETQGLTLWEAQFGDFVNGAQIQIDQFLAAGEAKWGQANGLVLLLPHGFDGQGPEHSSARLERFLQLCAENNMRVANPSTPAQYYHLLRKQALDPVRKPLIVMTPKSLLRAKIAGSPVQDLGQGEFQAVIPDLQVTAAQVERVVLCSGKVYYDLLQERGDRPIALLRMEQLYPIPEEELQQALSAFPKRQQLIWCQEEPENMGAYRHLCMRIKFDEYAGRSAAASPATGFQKAHKQQQQALVVRALG